MTDDKLIDQEILDIFFEEAEEHLRIAENSLLAMSEGDYSKEVIDTVFRVAHSFKGSAASLGMKGLTHLAHHLEDILVKLRKDEISASQGVYTVLFQGVDALRDYVAGLKKDISFFLDTTEIVRRIELAKIAKGDASAPSEAPLPSLPVERGSFPQKESPPKASGGSTEDEAIRVGLNKLDGLLNLVGELVVNQSMINAHVMNGTIASEEALQTLSYIEKMVTEVQGVTMGLRVLPVKPLIQKMKRIVRDLSTEQHKPIELRIEGEHVEIDKTVMDRISDPLTHLMRNAVDHGIEGADERVKTGKNPQAQVTLTFEQKEDHVLITVADDGRGLDRQKLIKKAIEKGLIAPDAQLTEQEAYSLIFRPGFSTKEQVTEVSGRGVGMDVVQKAIEGLKGSIQIETTLGKGSEFQISLPLSLSIVPGLVILVNQKKYVVPVAQLHETIELSRFNIENSGKSGKMVNVRGEVMPIFSLNLLLGEKKAAIAEDNARRLGLITEFRGRKVSFELDAILGQQQVVLKRLGSEMEGLPGVIAGTILSNGEPGLIIDLHDFIERGIKNVA